MPADSRPQHAAPPSDRPPVPEPPFGERVRTLLHLGRTGTLATHSRHHAGYPFASVMPYGLDAEGRPIFLISTMAMHTQNLQRDGRASLLVTQPGWTEDPLAGARATLLGGVAPVPAAARERARDDYLCRHENARTWVEFDDFSLWRMEIADVYFVAGFGAMGWVSATDYSGAPVDPLADAAAGILAHMNADHSDALVTYSRHFGGIAAHEAIMTSIDRLGFRMRTRSDEGVRGLRLNFPREIRTPEDARAVLIAMLVEARAGT